jgi:hypothetical protein
MITFIFIDGIITVNSSRKYENVFLTEAAPTISYYR